MLKQPSLNAIRAFFGGLISSPADEHDPRSYGCLMVNTVFELGRVSDEVRRKVDIYRQAFVLKFRERFIQDQIDEPERKAEFLVGMMWGALSHIRLTGDIQTAEPLVRELMGIIEQW